MLLLFHKVLYEHWNAPILSDAHYDQLERYVEELEGHPGVKPHPEAPTGKRPCPRLSRLPRTVHRWLGKYDKTGKAPAMPRELV